MCRSSSQVILENENGQIESRRNHRNDYLFNLYFHLRNAFSIRMTKQDIKKRAVLKNGDCNISRANLKKKRYRYLVDIFTTVVDMDWSYNVLFFSMGFIFSWLGFSVIWYYIALIHGDFNHLDDPDWLPCVTHFESFTSAFLFSIETQHTIGYGERCITTKCTEAVILLCVQCIIGVLIQAFLAGAVFVKLSRSKSRTRTLLFSHNAVVGLRDRKLCLMFRIADMRKSHMIVGQVRAQLIKKKLTMEGEELGHHIHNIDLTVDSCNDYLFFIWPSTAVHVIDENSPFYGMSASDLLQEEFEIIVSLEGVIESTGTTTQARTSYLPNEILWGRRFKQLVHYNDNDEEYKVDLVRMNYTYEVETPRCSAKELSEMQKPFDNHKVDLQPSKKSRKVNIPTNPSYELVKSSYSVRQTVNSYSYGANCDQRNNHWLHASR